MSLIIFLGCAFMALIIIFPPILLGAAIERGAEPGETGLALTFVIIEFIALVLVLYIMCKGAIQEENDDQ